VTLTQLDQVLRAIRDNAIASCRDRISVDDLANGLAVLRRIQAVDEYKKEAISQLIAELASKDPR